MSSSSASFAAISGLTTSATTIPALLLLISSSVMGMWADQNQWIQGSGILVTLLVSAFISNQGLVPIQHPLYDLAWTTFLPASLALLLFDSPRTKDAASSTAATFEHTIMDSILRVGIAFAVGSLGSILGCAVSFLTCRRCHTPSSFWMLPPRQAALAAGCLCASYIGGSVNFFATARILLTGNDNTSAVFPDRSSSSSSSSLLGAMATADLVVMAIYFALMASAVQSKALQNLFASKHDGDKATEAATTFNQQLATNDVKVASLLLDDTIPPRLLVVRHVLATSLVSLLALGVVKFANIVEARCSPILPGTACAVVALVAPLLSIYLSNWGRKSTMVLSLWNDMQHQARWLSELAFHWLFASIGASANISNVLKSGPACLLFSLLALLVHVIVIVAGSLGLQRGIPEMPNISWNEVLIASNAAIGGPATAAAFAGRIPPQQQQGRRYGGVGGGGGIDSTTKFGLTMAATFWGVVGYAIGTVIGTKLTQALVQALL